MPKTNEDYIVHPLTTSTLSKYDLVQHQNDYKIAEFKNYNSLYQKSVTPHIKSRKVHYLCGFPALCLLFELGVSFVSLNCICLSFV